MSSRWREGQASRRIKLVLVTVQTRFGAEKGTSRCNSILSLVLMLTLPLLQDYAVNYKYSASHLCSLNFS